MPTNNAAARLLRSARGSAVAALLLVSCATAPALRVEQASRVLTLSAIPARNQLRGGETVRTQMLLTNRSAHRVATCIGSGRVLHLIGLEPRYVKVLSASNADHPFCDVRVVLEPNAEHAWAESFTVPAASGGDAKLVVKVQILDASRCHPKYGCPTTWLSAEAPVTVH